jgi:hypothetical protein
MEIETIGRLGGLIYDLPEDEQDAVFARERTTRDQWQAAWAEVAPRMDEALTASYTAAFRAGLEQRAGEVRDLTEDEYRAAEVARRLERPPDPAGLSPAALLVAQYRWMDRLNASKRQMMRMEASVMLAVQAALGKYEVRPLPPPRLADRVRSRRCPSCDAPKLTQPRTPHVYCDHCGGLMGYDYEEARVVTHGIEPAFVTSTLIDGVRDELRDAWERGDDAAWADAWRWVYRTDMELCPEGWTPRVRQADFREALVAWSVETCRVANEPEVKAANERAREAFDHGVALVAGWGDPPAEREVRRAVQRHLRASDEALELEIQRYEALGLFVGHPDGLTPEVYRRSYRAGLVDQWRPWLDEKRLAIVREHVDAAESWIEVPAPALHRSACGGCGGPLAVVEGARALICEACGLRLDAERPRFPCPSCAAAVVVVPDAHEIACGHCGGVFLPGS